MGVQAVREVASAQDASQLSFGMQCLAAVLQVARWAAVQAFQHLLVSLDGGSVRLSPLCLAIMGMSSALRLELKRVEVVNAAS